MLNDTRELQATIQRGSIYLPPIAKRLNKLLPGVNLTNDNVHGALYACAYDLAAHGISPWCDAFSKNEIEDFEYELDLLMDGAFGYNLPTPMGPVLGGPGSNCRVLVSLLRARLLIEVATQDSQGRTAGCLASESHGQYRTPMASVGCRSGTSVGLTFLLQVVV